VSTVEPAELAGLGPVVVAPEPGVAITEPARVVVVAEPAAAAALVTVRGALARTAPSALRTWISWVPSSRVAGMVTLAVAFPLASGVMDWSRTKVLATPTWVAALQLEMSTESA